MAMDTLSRRLGHRIRTLRQGRGTTQERLAERAGISVSFLSMIEGGRRLPHLATVAKLAEALQVPLFELFRFEGSARTKPTEPRAA